MAQPKYFDKDILELLFNASKEIVSIRNQAFKQTGIDLLDTDAISSAFIYQIVSQYDSNYNVNFARNGEDAKSGNVIIEQKCATKEHTKRTGLVGLSGWQFHAQGGLEYPRYIFAVRRKDNLQIVRIWDVQSKLATDTVKQHLLDLKQRWIDRGKPNHDAIIVPEKLLLDLPQVKNMVINNCTVHII